MEILTCDHKHRLSSFHASLWQFKRVDFNHFSISLKFTIIKFAPRDDEAPFKQHWFLNGARNDSQSYVKEQQPIHHLTSVSFEKIQAVDLSTDIWTRQLNANINSELNRSHRLRRFLWKTQCYRWGIKTKEQFQQRKHHSHIHTQRNKVKSEI